MLNIANDSYKKDIESNHMKNEEDPSKIPKISQKEKD